MFALVTTTAIVLIALVTLAVIATIRRIRQQRNQPTISESEARENSRPLTSTVKRTQRRRITRQER